MESDVLKMSIWSLSDFFQNRYACLEIHARMTVHVMRRMALVRHADVSQVIQEITVKQVRFTLKEQKTIDPLKLTITY